MSSSFQLYHHFLLILYLPYVLRSPLPHPVMFPLFFHFQEYSFGFFSCRCFADSWRKRSCVKSHTIILFISGWPRLSPVSCAKPQNELLKKGKSHKYSFDGESERKMSFVCNICYIIIICIIMNNILQLLYCIFFIIYNIIFFICHILCLCVWLRSCWEVPKRSLRALSFFIWLLLPQWFSWRSVLHRDCQPGRRDEPEEQGEHRAHPQGPPAPAASGHGDCWGPCDLPPPRGHFSWGGGHWISIKLIGESKKLQKFLDCSETSPKAILRILSKWHTFI